VAARYAGRRVWAIFEPRSNTSRRNIHQKEYADAFEGAALATLRVPEKTDRVPAGEELDVSRLIEDLKSRGIQADGDAEVDRLVGRVADRAKKGDVLLVMSNGAFGGFIDKLLGALKQRAGQGA
jgi:UDP-N-acetylmuramate: L-alanyl-gamma-D-glutamyl-meso-diaminopimelate ligase